MVGVKDPFLQSLVEHGMKKDLLGSGIYTEKHPFQDAPVHLGGRDGLGFDALGSRGGPSSLLGHYKAATKAKGIIQGNVFNDYSGKLKQDVANAAMDRRKPDPTTVGLRTYPPTLQDQDEQQIAKLLEERGITLEKPQGSCLHHALQELASNGLPLETRNFMLTTFQSFVVQHDWAAAFKGATDFDQGDVPLPFPFTAFEFRISGLRVIVCLGDGTETEGQIGVVMTGINDRWYIPVTKLQWLNGRLHDMHKDSLEEDARYGSAFINTLSDQIRAVCIMLDAEVAESAVVRVSEKLNRNRIKAGKTPLKDYHIVNLSNRHRVKPPETSPPSDRRRPKLHMRRGHWRHFTDHRTWIKWMLVGNPDLGFVDKEYRL